MSQALALLEFESVAVGLLAVDRMLKNAPVSLLRCGTVHPGKYLALVGGTVASTAEAHQVGVATGTESSCLVTEVMLPDPHGSLAEALVGGRHKPQGDTLGVFEVSHSPGLLKMMDHILKAVPVGLVEIRLADDLGGRALALVHGDLTHVQEAAVLAPASLDDPGQLLNVAVISRLDETLKSVLEEGTHFGTCRNMKPVGGEMVED